jgi:methyl-accepting chemotaxis protein
MVKNPDSGRPRFSFSANTIRIASLTLVVITIIALGAVAYFTERGIVVSRDWVIHTYRVRSQLSDLQLEIMRARANETAELLTPDRDRHPGSTRQDDLARQTVSALHQLTKDNPLQQNRLTQVESLLDEGIFLESQNSTGTRTYISPPEHMRQQQIDERERQFDALVNDMQAEEEDLLQQRLKDWDYLFKRNIFMLGLAFAIVAIMLAYNFRFFDQRGRAYERYGEASTGQCRFLPIDECQNSGIARLGTAAYCARAPR